MSENWTKGPWEIRKYKGPYSDHNLSVEIATDEIIIAKLGVELDEECAANARLIAAAPEMYEALDKISRRIQAGTLDEWSWQALVDLAERTIKKARGES